MLAAAGRVLKPQAHRLHEYDLQLFIYKFLMYHGLSVIYSYLNCKFLSKKKIIVTILRDAFFVGHASSLFGLVGSRRSIRVGQTKRIYIFLCNYFYFANERK